MADPMSNPPSRARQALFLSVPFVLLVVVLLLVEGFLRLALPRIDPIELLVTAPQQRKAFLEDQPVRAFQGDPLLLWSLRPNLDHVVWNLTMVSTNADGVRYPRAVGPKPAGSFRILCLGDSVTFGFRVPRVLPRKPQDYDPTWLPYPALLEAALRAANPGRTIEVIPLAVPGYTSHQGLAWLRRDIERYAPDVVTACFGWNDINHRARTDRQTMAMDAFSVQTRRLLSSSQLLIRLGLAVRHVLPVRAAASGDLPTMRVPRAEYVENLLEMARLVKAHGAVPVFIGPVYRDRVAHPPEGDEIHAHRAALRVAAEHAQIAYLEIPELTEDQNPANAHLFEEHIHPNRRGHRLMAERLGRFLADRGLLQNLRPPQ